jgi:hypothetical protein
MVSFFYGAGKSNPICWQGRCFLLVGFELWLLRMDWAKALLLFSRFFIPGTEVPGN